LNLQEYVYHEAFMTAAVRFKNGVEVDLIRCRKEVYERNGALPTVIPSDITDDLGRRDFTVNALAFDVVEGKVIDPFGGAADISAKIIRSVHKDSYREDPTRIFRAVKYSARYGFEIFDADEIRSCLAEGVFSSISSERYFNEIYSLCKETSWRKAFLSCTELGIFDLDRRKLSRKSIFADYSDPDTRLLKLAYSLVDNATVIRMADNSMVPGEIRGALKRCLKDDSGSKLSTCRDNYEIYLVLKNSSRYERIILSFDKTLAYKVLNYEKNMGLKLFIDGEYVKSAGVEEGRAVGKVLEYMMMLKLNLGLEYEKTYFDENIGEILDVIKYKA
ncbi:MAG TPA: CCA tRNA nucleotidyltransferase, partial [Clostridiaceae bacterium]|nr:CCA tRNA nucleotidyltransferase [Clostridiaceae bacterium]